MNNLNKAKLKNNETQYKNIKTKIYFAEMYISAVLFFKPKILLLIIVFYYLISKKPYRYLNTLKIKLYVKYSSITNKLSNFAIY